MRHDRARRNAHCHRQTGITMIELLIVITIISILGAIGYPSYMEYVTRTKRAAAKSVLLQIAERQELFFADTKSYAANLAQLGYDAATFMVNEDGTAVPDGDGERLYAISLTNTSATTFTINAAPEMQQASHDQDCQTLTFTHIGIRGQTGPSMNCW